MVVVVAVVAAAVVVVLTAVVVVGARKSSIAVNSTSIEPRAFPQDRVIQDDILTRPLFTTVHARPLLGTYTLSRCGEPATMIGGRFSKVLPEIS